MVLCNNRGVIWYCKDHSRTYKGNKIGYHCSLICRCTCECINVLVVGTPLSLEDRLLWAEQPNIMANDAAGTCFTNSPSSNIHVFSSFCRSHPGIRNTRFASPSLLCKEIALFITTMSMQVYEVRDIYWPWQPNRDRFQWKNRNDDWKLKCLPEANPAICQIQPPSPMVSNWSKISFRISGGRCDRFYDDLRSDMQIERP